MADILEYLDKIDNSTKDYEILTRCRVCGSSKQKKYLDLGETPLANNFVSSVKLNNEQYYPLNVVLCNDCYFSQLSIVVRPEIMFKEYTFRSSISNTFTKHCNEFKQDIIEEFDLKKDQLIIDIASNDGTLLKHFKDVCRVLGIEPSLNIAKLSSMSGIDTIEAFWSERIAEYIVDKYGKALIVSAFNVFAHVNNIHSFIKGVKKVLSKNGYFVLEFPHHLQLVRNNEFDTVYHEHLSYLLIKPLVRLFELYSMRIARVEEYDIHGGSVRLYVEHLEGKNRSDESLIKMLEFEMSSHLFKISTYSYFQDRIKIYKHNFIAKINQIKIKGKIIAGYGASAKGSTLLNYCNLSNSDLVCIFDGTPEKQNKLTPGTNIPILPEDQLGIVKPDYLLLLAWNYADEIIEKTSEFKKHGGRYIVPLPSFRLI